MARTTLSPSDVLNRLNGKRRSGDGWSAKCPAHEDAHNSLSISVGEGGKVLLYCHAGCQYDSIVRALSDTVAVPNSRKDSEVYPYCDDKDRVLYEVVRYFPKDFAVRRPDGKGGYIYNNKGVGRILYRLPQLLSADRQKPVFVVEGEKDADRLALIGLIATTNIGGAGKWHKEYSESLRSRHVVIVPDNDEPGKKHAEQVALSAYPIAASVKILSLPNLPPKGDTSDYLDAGGTSEALLNLAEEVRDWHPKEEGDEPDTDKQGRKSQATRLLELANEAVLFHTQDDEAYARIQVKGHTETWSLKSRGFHDWMSRRFYQEEGKAPNRQGIKDALDTLSGKARFDGEQRDVYTRIAAHQGAIYIDLADDNWRIVKITPEGWTIIDAEAAPINFRRTRGELPLPLPERGGSLNDLMPFVNIKGMSDRSLLLAWLVASLRPGCPIPLLALYGAQGCAKSTTARVLSSIVDPGKAPLRSEPRNEQDLMIAAKNRWCLTFDNLSYISLSLSDALCRLSTGGGLATRELYSDDEEVIFDALRPLIINGIEDLTTRGDLLSRAIILYLPTINKSSRRVEDDFWKEFDHARPGILGALYDAVSMALRRTPEVRLHELPRMADFALFAMAAEPSFGVPQGTFLKSYEENRNVASTVALDDSPLTEVLTRFIEKHLKWAGNATKLLSELNLWASEEIKRAKNWPKGPNALSGKLRRLEPALRDVGIDVHAGRNNMGSCITIRRLGSGVDESEYKKAGEGASASSLAPLGFHNQEHKRGATQDSDALLEYTERASVDSSSPANSGQSQMLPSSGIEGDDSDDPFSGISAKHTFVLDNEEIEERAAIIEFEGGYTTEDAERLALDEYSYTG
jgi:hypothetical protein